MKMQLRKNFSLSPQAKAMLNLMGVQGFFWFAWAFANYQTVYLQNNGMTSSDIGVLNAVCSVVGIFASATWGMISDKINSIKKTFIIVLTLSAVTFVIMPLLPAQAKYATIMFIVYCALATFVRNPVGTLLDNLTVRNCAVQGLNYGPIRAFGSFMFTISSTLCTMMLAHMSVKWTFWITAILVIIPIMFVVYGNDPKFIKPANTKNNSNNSNDMKLLFKNYYYVTFLIFTAVLYIPLSTEGAFIPFLMEEKNIPNTNYGVFLAVRALMEIPFLFFIAKLRAKIKLKYIVIAAVALMGLECILQGLFTDTFLEMCIFACFFGLGHDLWIGSIAMYMYKLAPDSLKASAQSFYASVASAAAIIGHLVGGFAYELLGGPVFYIVIGIILLAAGGFFVLTHLFGKMKGIPNPADELN